jgi:hypothetical protein
MARQRMLRTPRVRFVGRNHFVSARTVPMILRNVAACNCVCRKATFDAIGAIASTTRQQKKASSITDTSDTVLRGNIEN